jgi:type IV secretory pathway VirB3-like protein
MEEEKGWKRVAAVAVVLGVMVFLIWIQTNNPWWEWIGIPFEEVGPLLCIAQVLMTGIMIVFYIIYQNLKKD